MTFNYITDCFYEKRTNIALQGYNDLNDRWTSDFDCFDRCLRIDHHKCRSFEYWHREQHGLCVRANISLSDHPSITGHSAFVDYYEINCRKDNKGIRPSAIHCPNDQLFLTVRLNGIHANKTLLGDTSCQASWSNTTHVQFITHIDNCSLVLNGKNTISCFLAIEREMLINGSIIGKLRWETGHRDNNSSKQYERFFACPSNMYQVRSMHQISNTPEVPNSRQSSSMLPNHDEQKLTLPYRITIQWILHNHSYSCPGSCLLSLYSYINITLVDLSLLTSRYSIDSCDLQALSPYTNYLQAKRLIFQGCSVDPTVIHVPIHAPQLSIFYFSFYLYHILKEPIPFEIQCKILHTDDKLPSQEQHHIDCLSLLSMDTINRSFVNKNDKRNDFYTLFRSSSAYVTRELSPDENKQRVLHHQNTRISIATVHYIECSLFVFCVLILYAI